MHKTKNITNANPASFPADGRGGLMSIGKFDGVHLGHQALFRAMHAEARNIGQRITAQTENARTREKPSITPPVIAVVLDPPPAHFFGHHREALMDFEAKQAMLAEFGVKAYRLPFDSALAACSAEGFITDYLIRTMAVRALWVGADFRFGQNRTGDVAFLRERAPFAVHCAPNVVVEGERVASSAIRRALRSGDIVRASMHLGRPYAFSGEVVCGQGLGRTLGAPTANVAPGFEPPLAGVYAVHAEVAGSIYPAVMNVGVRPTVAAGGTAQHTPQHIEVHALDAPPNTDWYGDMMHITPRRFIRTEQKFPDTDALRAQIAKDISAARAWFAAHP